MGIIKKLNEKHRNPGLWALLPSIIVAASFYLGHRALKNSDKPKYTGLEQKVVQVQEVPKEEVRDVNSVSYVAKENNNLNYKNVKDVNNMNKYAEPQKISKNVNNMNKYAEPQKISKNGLQLIKQYEGFSPVVYDDFGNPAIGYGHRIKKREKFKEISEQEAENLLAKDLNPIEKIVSEYVEVPLSQNQYDALCSFVYNVGENNFKRSTLLKKLNNGNYNAVADEIKRWKKANGKVVKGLEIRREKESDLWKNLIKN